MDQAHSRDVPALKMMHDVFVPVSFTAGDVAKCLKHCPGLSALQCYVGETHCGVRSPIHLIFFPVLPSGNLPVRVDLGRSYISASETLGIPKQPNRNI